MFLDRPQGLLNFHLYFSFFLLKLCFLNLSQELPEPFGVTSANGAQMPRRKPTVSLRWNSDTKQLLKIIVAKWYCLHNSFRNQLLGKRVACLMSPGSSLQKFLLFAMAFLVSCSWKRTDIKDNECTDSHFCYRLSDIKDSPFVWAEEAGPH